MSCPGPSELEGDRVGYILGEEWLRSGNGGGWGGWGGCPCQVILPSPMARTGPRRVGEGDGKGRYPDQVTLLCRSFSRIGLSDYG